MLTEIWFFPLARENTVFSADRQPMDFFNPLMQALGVHGTKGVTALLAIRVLVHLSNGSRLRWHFGPGTGHVYSSSAYRFGRCP